MLGNLLTSVLGFGRAFVIARFYGATPQTDAFFAALVVPQMFYDLLIGGAIAAALIPSFTRLAGEDKDELWSVVGSMFVLMTIFLTVVVLMLEAAARPLMTLIASGLALHAGMLAVKLVRLLLPSLLFMGLSALALATLYSLHRRVVASFASVFYHLGIIGAAIIASARLGIEALPLGAIVGAALQFIVQVPSLIHAYRETGIRSPRIRLDLRNPAVHGILRLYAPVAVGIVISIAGQIADVNFKTHLPQTGGFTSMQIATQLIQFPVGVVVAALGLAVLPSISADAAFQRLAAFKETLALGFRLILLLMVPAMVGLLTLAKPLVTVLFQHGHFTHTGTIWTATALMGYAPQLPFIGIDQLLIFAFYARHNTLTPMLAGMAGVCIYVIAAAVLLGPLTIFGLALANTIQIAAHALILLVLLHRSIGSIAGHRLLETGLKVGIAAAGMALAVLAVERWLPPFALGHVGQAVALVVPMLVAVAVYGCLIFVLGVDEARWLSQLAVRGVTGQWNRTQPRDTSHAPPS